MNPIRNQRREPNKQAQHRRGKRDARKGISFQTPGRVSALRLRTLCKSSERRPRPPLRNRRHNLPSSARSSSASPGNWPVGKGGGAQQPRGSVDRPSPPRTAQHGPVEPTAGSSRIQIPRTELAELEETQGRSQPAASPWTGHGKAGGPGSRGSRPPPLPKI